MTDLTYFARYGTMSHPGPYADRYADLPSDVPSLVRVVQGLMVHVFWGERYGLNLSEERKAEVQLRRMEFRLERTLELNPAPLTSPRRNEQKIVGNCRDFSVMLASMLQSKGIPARPRCGFGAYPSAPGWLVNGGRSASKRDDLCAATNSVRTVASARSRMVTAQRRSKRRSGDKCSAGSSPTPRGA